MPNDQSMKRNKRNGDNYLYRNTNDSLKIRMLPIAKNCLDRQNNIAKPNNSIPITKELIHIRKGDFFYQCGLR